MHNAHIASHGKAETILKVVLATVGVDADYTCEQNESISSQIYRFADLAEPSTSFHRYLLGLDRSFKAAAVTQRSASTTFPRTSEQSRARATDTILHQLTQFRDALLSLCTQTSTRANQDVFETVATVCVVAIEIVTTIVSRYGHAESEAQATLSRYMEVAVCDYGETGASASPSCSNHDSQNVATGPSNVRT